MDGQGSTRVLFRLWLVIVGVVAIAVLYLAKVLFLPLGFAILFAFLLAPLVSTLQRIRLPRTVASAVVILGFFSLLCVGTWFLFTQIVSIANDLPTYRANINQKLAAIKSPSNSAFSRARQEIERLGNELGVANSLPLLLEPDGGNENKPLGASPEHPVSVREVSGEASRLNALGGVVEPLVIGFLTIVFTFFVLLEREDLRNRLIRLSGDRNLPVVTEALDDASRRISRYFRMLLTVNVVYGTIIFVALWTLGLPHALLFGALAGLLRFIPYIGAPVATGLPTALSLAVFHGWEKALTIVCVFACLELTTANFIEPRIYGRHTGLSPLAVLGAAGFWTLLWGPVGLLLSVPLTVCLVVMGRHVPALNFLTVMLGDQPPMPAWTCFYQRLLAHDEREAGEILESCADSKPLADVYDSVLVPALVMSEEDRLHRDLEESSVRYIRRSVREVIEELGYREYRPGIDFGLSPPQAHATLPLKVLCIPVRDETDELAAMMLEQALGSIQIRAVAIPVRRLDETVEMAAREKPDIAVLAGLPPFSFARAHRIYRSLRAGLPQLRVAAGIWNAPDEAGEAARKITGGEDMRVFTRLADAVAELRAMAEPQDSSRDESADGRNAA